MGKVGTDRQYENFSSISTDEEFLCTVGIEALRCVNTYTEDIEAGLQRVQSRWYPVAGRHPGNVDLPISDAARAI